MARKQALPTGLYLRGGRYWMDFTDPLGQRHRGSLATADLATAKAILEKEKAKLVAQAHGLAPKETGVSAFRTAYLDAARLRLAPPVLEARRRQLDAFLDYCGVQRLDAIRPEHISGFAASILEQKRKGPRDEAGVHVLKPLKRSTALDYLKAVRAALRWAVRHDYLERNPFDRADRLAPDEVDKRIVFLTPEERDRLLDACDDPIPNHGRGRKGKGTARPRRTRLRAMAAIAVHAGLRLSEIIWLDWQDVDFERGEITIRNKDGWKTKTRSERVIPLFPTLRAVLEPMRLPAGPVFTTSTGQRYTRRNLLRELELAVDRAKIAKSASWNVLRHTFATTLVSAGVALFAVSRWLGHKTTRVTEAHYAAFAPNDALVKQAAIALGAAAKGKGKKGAAVG